MPNQSKTNSKVAMPQRNPAEAVNSECNDGTAPSCDVDVSFMIRRQEIKLLQYNITKTSAAQVPTQ
jgi:hypothetical protein